MFKKIILLILLIFVSCNLETPTQFSKQALNDKVYSLVDKPITFKEVVNQYKGKKVFIDFWASWCGDCIKGMPKVKQLQQDFPKVVFLFLSVDKRRDFWKRGINRYDIKGEHYNLPKGMKDGDLVNFIRLGWIPRYMVIDENGKILLFKATDALDKDIKTALKKTL